MSPEELEVYKILVKKFSESPQFNITKEIAKEFEGLKYYKDINKPMAYIPDKPKKSGQMDHPIFSTFKKVALLCKNSKHQKEILKYILSDTKHTSLIAYHSDKTIPLADKLSRYNYIIGTYEPCSSPDAQPSSVFGYSQEPTTGAWASPSPSPSLSPGLETAYEKKESFLLKKELKDALSHIKDLKENSDNQQHLISTLIKEKEAIDEKRPKILEVKVNDVLKGKVEGERFHKQLPLIVKLLTSRNAMGFSEFLYIWGAPGAGKTHMSKQIAKALGVKCFTYPVGPTITEGKLLGFNNIATGTFIPGWLYEAYKSGGLIALDEIDLADAAVLGATNSIENDTYAFGNGEFITRHVDFYLIAFANTQGTGSTKGFTRNILDAATRDRFTQIKLEYDMELERDIYGHEKWALYVQLVRKYVEDTCNSSIYITPRATRKGAAYLNAGVDIDTVCDITIFKSCTKDIKKAILENVGKFTL